jgi:hypothetical protein
MSLTVEQQHISAARCMMGLGRQCAPELQDRSQAANARPSAEINLHFKQMML